MDFCQGWEELTLRVNFTLAGLTALADIMAMAVSFMGAFHLRNTLGLHPAHHTVRIEDYESFLIYVVLIWLLFLKNCGAYALYNRSGQEDISRPVVMAASYSFVVMMAATFLIKGYDLSRLVFLLFTVLSALALIFIRAGFQRLLHGMRRRGRGLVNCLLVGTVSQSRGVSERLLHPLYGLNALGLVLTSPELTEQTCAGQDELPILGTLEDLEGLISTTQAREIYFLPGSLQVQELFALRNRLASTGVAMSMIPDPDTMVPTATAIKFFDGLMAIELLPGRSRRLYRSFKRLFDIFFSLILLVLLSPLLGLIALLVRLLDGAPVLFVQKRVGLQGRIFHIYKFRTMEADAPAYEASPRHGEQGDPRLTALGRWLRKFCLDELPQFFNVLKGDMSIVGPRPEMPFIVEKYDHTARRRLEVLPGITGMWQVYGRHRMAYIHEDIKFDIYYVENQTFLLDLELIAATIPVILFGRGSA